MGSRVKDFSLFPILSSFDLFSHFLFLLAFLFFL